MSDIVTNHGLQRIGVQSFQATGTGVTYNVARHIQTGSIDDNSGTVLSSHDQLNDRGAVSNQFDVVFDATPTRSGQTITCIFTIVAGSGNFTIRTVSIHDDTVANVSASSASLVAAIDGQSLTKTADFSIEFTITMLFTDAS